MRNDAFRLHCRTCSETFLEMVKLLQHRERCPGDAQKRARGDGRDAGQPNLPTEPSASPQAGKGAR
jgi:hypothetical protein